MQIACRIWQVLAVLVLAGGQAVSAAPTRVEVVPICFINELGVMAQTIVDGRSDDSTQPGKPYFPRYLWRIDCSRETAKCVGARVNVRGIEQGAPVQMLDVVVAEEMRLISVQDRVARIWWPQQMSGVAITIDLDKKRFEYKSTGALGESAGVGACSDGFPG